MKLKKTTSLSNLGLQPTKSEQEQGLTKREYFAIRILQAYAADDQQDLDDREKALFAVAMADELIVALKENPATPRS